LRKSGFRKIWISHGDPLPDVSESVGVVIVLHLTRRSARIIGFFFFFFFFPCYKGTRRRFKPLNMIIIVVVSKTHLSISVAYESVVGPKNIDFPAPLFPSPR